MRRVRILVGPMPGLLQGIVEGSLGREPDMELLEFDEGIDLSLQLEIGLADVVIVTDSGDRPANSRQLLVEHPGLKVMVVTNDGRSAQMLELTRVPLVDVSPRGLADAIRRAMRLER